MLVSQHSIIVYRIHTFFCGFSIITKKKELTYFINMFLIIGNAFELINYIFYPLAFVSLKCVLILNNTLFFCD